MGIGLTVASCIVRLHHGDIAVHSDGAERGTQVVITLPLIAAHTARSESLNG
jgi:signal transduction histidine kinase